jgi:class 3 adenylate cyclase
MVPTGATLVQYVFLDVVAFTQGRTIEAQADVVEALNRIVLQAIGGIESSEHDRIILPTGDGMAIAILNPAPFDVALTAAKAIMRGVHEHSSLATDSRRAFKLRVGVNQNIDNVVIDINGSANVVGRGINQAQRIMAMADAGQIMAGAAVFDVLCEREAYAGAFKEYRDRDKHGNQLSVYQLIAPKEDWLNTDAPRRFQPPKPRDPEPLDDYSAHYIAQALKWRDLLLAHREDVSFIYTSAIMLHLLASESMESGSASHLERRSSNIQVDAAGTPLPMMAAIQKTSHPVLAALDGFITQRLQWVAACFEKGQYYELWAFPSETGRRRLAKERPEVWRAVLNTEPEV